MNQRNRRKVRNHLVPLVVRKPGSGKHKNPKKEIQRQKVKYHEENL